MRRTNQQRLSPREQSAAQSHVLQRSCACGTSRRGGACGCGARQAPSIVHDVIRSSGHALDAETRAAMESRFGRSFSDVRVHSDARAAESARAVDAAAYTVGRHVVFGPDRYRPRTATGNHLLAHELTHVVQQRFAAGAASDLSVGAAHDPGEREAERAAGAMGGPSRVTPVDGGVPVLRRQAASAPMGPPGVCGPDATDWLVRQIAAAKGDRTVLAIQENLAQARWVASSRGLSAERLAEGGTSLVVRGEAARVGAPAPTGEAPAQLQQSERGLGELALAGLDSAFTKSGLPALALGFIARAALAWKDLVGTGQRYDFKNDSTTMRRPTVAGCPLGCPDTVTLCTGTSLACFGSDVPGNLFYAHVGRFVGWTELSLQLGSQFAQLESSKRWDPLEDTSMIGAGFGIPNPAARADVCAAAAGLNARACTPCPLPTAAAVR